MNKPWSVSPERCGGTFDACYQLEAVSLKRLLPVRLRLRHPGQGNGVETMKTSAVARGWGEGGCIGGPRKIFRAVKLF